jgi:hypothetical protein
MKEYRNQNTGDSRESKAEKQNVKHENTKGTKHEKNGLIE